jgi:hypothetical protein
VNSRTWSFFLGAMTSVAIREVAWASSLDPLLDLGGGQLSDKRWWRPGLLAGCSVPLAARRLGYLCFAQEPSLLDEAPELLALVRHQVGFASLEPNQEVGGELEEQVGGSSPAGRRCSRSGFFCARSPGRLNGDALPNRAFLPTVSWTSVAR